MCGHGASTSRKRSDCKCGGGTNAEIPEPLRDDDGRGDHERSPLKNCVVGSKEKTNWLKSSQKYGIIFY